MSNECLTKIGSGLMEWSKTAWKGKFQDGLNEGLGAFGFVC